LKGESYAYITRRCREVRGSSFHPYHYFFQDHLSSFLYNFDTNVIVLNMFLRLRICRRRWGNLLFTKRMKFVFIFCSDDIRIIQVQLDHADLSTTQVYTKVSNKLLTDTYHRTHPAAIKQTNCVKTCVKMEL